MTRAALIVALGACNASTGTLTLELVAAPGSEVIANIDRLRLTLTSPAVTFEASRTATGLDLVFEIEAVQTDGVLVVEGFAADGARFVVGSSPPFPLAGSEGRVAIYVAPPYSIERAPADLLPPRSQVAGVSLIYGAALAGGLDAAGAPSASMAIYNIYDHTIGYGEDLPVRRASVTLAANDTAGVYVLGGTDDTTTATATLYRFQSNIAPRGVYADLGVHPGLESAGQRAIKLGFDTFFVTGPQPALITASTIEALPALPNIPPMATPATTVADVPIAAFLRDGAIGTFAADRTVGEIALPSTETGRAIVHGAPGTVVVVGGATRDAIVVTLATGATTTRAEVLSVARRSPTIAATSRHILVANGLDENGDVIPSADILDAATLERLATQPLAPRSGAVALAMPNDQILIAGGDRPGEAPDGLVELFTPPADPAPP